MAARKFLDLDGLSYFIKKIIGKTDISDIGDGTCTGGLAALNQGLSDCLKSVADGKNALLGTISAYWSEASKWNADGTGGKLAASWANLQDMITNVYNAGNNSGYNSGYNVGYNNGKAAGRPAQIQMDFLGGQGDAGSTREEVYRLHVPTGYTTVTVKGNTTLCGYGSTIQYELRGFKKGASTYSTVTTWTAQAGSVEHFNGSHDISEYQGGFIEIHRCAAHAATGSYFGYMILQ